MRLTITYFHLLVLKNSLFENSLELMHINTQSGRVSINCEANFKRTIEILQK